jgi:hypothetical protein
MLARSFGRWRGQQRGESCLAQRRASGQAGARDRALTRWLQPCPELSRKVGWLSGQPLDDVTGELATLVEQSPV